jgi:hypothetical protein
MLKKNSLFSELNFQHVKRSCRNAVYKNKTRFGVILGRPPPPSIHIPNLIEIRAVVSYRRRKWHNLSTEEKLKSYFVQIFYGIKRGECALHCYDSYVETQWALRQPTFSRRVESGGGGRGSAKEEKNLRQKV